MSQYLLDQLNQLPTKCKDCGKVIGKKDCCGHWEDYWLCYDCWIKRFDKKLKKKKDGGL